jgi:hypothetical protein
MRPIRLNRSAAAVVLALFLTPATAGGDGYAVYLAEADGVVSALQSGVDPQSQRAALEALAAQADDLVDAFSLRFPACRDYLAAARGLKDHWPSLTLAQIESDYHHDGALPAIAAPEDRALCYQMKDLLVHPLTALRMLGESPVDRAGVEHEIVEVIAHGRALQALMAK